MRVAFPCRDPIESLTCLLRPRSGKGLLIRPFSKTDHQIWHTRYREDG